MEKKKNINTKLDDEAVEQLVENRFSSEGEKSHAVKRRKKKKNIGLNILIGVLSFFLVFSIFFLGAYIFFTATPHIEVSEKKVSQTDKKDKEASSENEIKDKESDESEASKKTEADKNQSGEKQFSAELDEKAQEEIDRNTKDKVKGSVKPASTTSNTVKPKSETKKQASVKKETTANKTEKSESSIPTVKDKDVVEKKPVEDKNPVSSEKTDISEKTETPDKTDSSDAGTPTDTSSSTNSSDSTQGNETSTVIDNKESSEGIIFE